jgi:hypothetical protein
MVVQGALQLARRQLAVNARIMTIVFRGSIASSITVDFPPQHGDMK